MRIGEFAKKHNTTIDTIRHYLDLGLLIAEKVGGQYRFNRDDSWDLEKIFELKQYEFSLSQIQELLSFHRLAGDHYPEYRRYYLDMLESKKDIFNKEAKRFKELEASISDKILDYQSSEESLMKLGLPILSMEIFECPRCRGKLEVFNGIIEKNMIMSGKIRCECGFVAKIENGIYIDEKDIRQKTLVGKKMPTKKEYLDIASSKYINFYYNGMSKSADYIFKYSKQPEYILELDSCVGSFLMQYIDDLPVDSTYILNCQDLDRISSMKENIQLHFKHSNFIFICCDPSNLPVGKSKIDLVIDHGKTNEFYRLYNKELASIYSPLLKDNGILVGAFRYVDNKSNDFQTIPLVLKDRYNKDKIIYNLEKLDFKKIESTEIGPIMEDNPLSVDIGGKESYMIIYAGRKV